MCVDRILIVGCSRLGDGSGRLEMYAMFAISISMDEIGFSTFRSRRILSTKPPKAIVDLMESVGFLPSPHLLDSTK